MSESEDLSPSKELLEFIVDRVNVGIFVLNENMEVLLWNKFMVTHSNMMPSEVRGKNICDVFPDLPKRWFKKKLDSVFMLKSFAFTSWEQRPYLFKFPHNRPVTGGAEYMSQDFTLMPIKDSSGTVTSVVVTLFDSTDVSIYKMAHQEALERLEVISQVDALTGLYNRGHWEKMLRIEVERVKRYGGELTLILFDLDHFKKVNDTYGHLGGDEVLKQVAVVVKESIREHDIGGRYGGEEFGVILPSTSIEGAITVAERLKKKAMDSLVTHDGQEIKFTISQGISTYKDGLEDHDKLLAMADEALYVSKEKGRNQFNIHGTEDAE